MPSTVQDIGLYQPQRLDDRHDKPAGIHRLVWKKRLEGRGGEFSRAGDQLLNHRTSNPFFAEEATAGVADQSQVQLGFFLEPELIT